MFHGVKIQNYIHLIKLQPSFRTDPFKFSIIGNKNSGIAFPAAKIQYE
nr:MAG TPA: hypothetical protein [Caudoviricetes sp.]